MIPPNSIGKPEDTPEPDVRAILATLRVRFEALYGDRLRRLILFGSRARGDADPSSDIDVLVVLQDPVDSYQELERTGAIVAELSLEHTVVISCVFVSASRYDPGQSALLVNVRTEGVPV